MAPVAVPVVVPVREPEPEPEVETAVVEDFLDIDVTALDDLFGDTGFSDAGSEVDSFWDDALTENTPKVRGFSLEDARKQGLIPTDSDLNDLPK